MVIAAGRITQIDVTDLEAVSEEVGDSFQHESVPPADREDAHVGSAYKLAAAARVRMSAWLTRSSRINVVHAETGSLPSGWWWALTARTAVITVGRVTFAGSVLMRSASRDIRAVSMALAWPDHAWVAASAPGCHSSYKEVES